MPYKLGVVKFNFIPINEDHELRLQKGQEVLILEQDAVNGWARGLLVEPDSELSSSIQGLTSGTGTTTAGLRRRKQGADGEKKKGSHILSPYLREAREQGLVRLFPGSHVRVLHVFQEEGSGLEEKRGSKEIEDFAVEDYSPLSTPREIEKERERSVSAGSELESTPSRHQSRNRNLVTAAKARLGFSTSKGAEGTTDSGEKEKEKKSSTRDRHSEVLTRPRAQSAGERSSVALHRLVHGSSDQPTENEGSEGDHTTDEDHQQANEENADKPHAREKKSRRRDRLLKLASFSDMGKRRSTAATRDASLTRESSLEELAKSLRRRVHVMREIYETERTYVRTLETVVEVYMRPLHECISNSKIGLSPRIIPRVFGNVELLLNLQRIILGELELRVSSGLTANTCFGDVFLKMIPFLKSYTQYVNNYPDSIAAMTLLVKDKRFLEFLQSRVPKGSLGGDYVLSDLLITPIQRLPRYEMLLKDLLKVTPEDHQDYADLSKAALQITEVARYVNSRRAEFETTNKILDIQSKFVNSKQNKPVTLIKPSRRLIREGQAEVEGEDHILYLFNDCLLIASIKPGDRRGLKHNLSLFGASVYIPPPTTFGFEFAFKTGGSTQEVTFLVHAQKELQEWIHDLQQSIESFTSKKTQIMTAGNLPLHLWCKAGDLAKIQEHFERTSIGGIEDQEETSSLDVNARNSAGKTALMIAAKQGNMAIVKYLVEVAGASVHLRTANGASAHDIATAAGQEAIADFLGEKERALSTPRLTPRDGPIMPTSASVGDIANDSATFAQKLKKKGKAKLLTLKRSVGSPWSVPQAHPTPADDAHEIAVLNIKKEISRLDARSKELKNQLVEVMMERRKWEEKLDKAIAARQQSSAPLARHQSNPTLVISSSGDSIPEEPTDSIPTTPGTHTRTSSSTLQEQPLPSPPQHRPHPPPRVPLLRMRINRSISPIAQS